MQSTGHNIMMAFFGRPSAWCLTASCIVLPVLAPTNTALAAQHSLPSPAADRLTWGAGPFVNNEQVGTRPWLDDQVKMPLDVALPAAAQAQIDGLPISQRDYVAAVVDLDAAARAAKQLTDVDQKQAALTLRQQTVNEYVRETRLRSLLRALYAPDQLREQMVWFWFNQFNVSPANEVGLMVGDYQDRAIRPYALARYRDLLGATLHHAAMLRFLNNDQNAVGHINENYAREIMELHSMGVGSGYSQKDVQELARILTGVGINLKPDNPKLKPAWQPLYVRAGLFEFNPARHDFGDKIFLGHTIKGAGFSEVEQALDLIAESPATAHHISQRMAMFFMGDKPSPAIVERMAATFQRSKGDIAAVLKTMFGSPEFKASRGTVFKDPVHYALSAVRVAYGDTVIPNPQRLTDWLGRMGEVQYGYPTPDGYPLDSAAWSGPGQLSARFDFARELGTGRMNLFKPPVPAVFPVMPAPVGSPSATPVSVSPSPPSPPVVPQIRDTAYFKALEPTLSERTRAVLAQAASPEEWNTLFFSSPEFMHR